jgi:hypothetical protein
MKPFDATRIGLSTKVIAQNSSATLLAPDGTACHGK